MIRKPDKALQWQSKTILLLVVPWTVASVILQAHWWLVQEPTVAWQSLGISALFGLIVWRLKAATPAGAATGAAITASLMFSTARYPYRWSWLHGGLLPLLTVFLLTYAATKIGKAKKERLGTGEGKRGRNAAQVAANLGIAALAAQSIQLIQTPHDWAGELFLSIAALTALAEAAADTVSSEIGQVFGGEPLMLTTLQRVPPGTDGGVSLAGTFAGATAALIVAGVGSAMLFTDLPRQGHFTLAGMIGLAGTLGLLFDSLLGAMLERKGYLNNDAVNFLSTMSAAVFGLAELYLLLASAPI